MLKDQPDDVIRGYFEHVQRVYDEASRVHGPESLEAAVARFHDALEDGEMDLAELKTTLARFFEEKPTQTVIDVILEACKVITRHLDETYMQYIARVKKHPLARAVKIIDLRVNLYGSPTLPPGRLAERYLRALHELQNTSKITL